MTVKKTIIIAEIGECFNGDLGAAKKLIREAKTAGCDIAKFQTLDCENISEDDPEKEWFRKIALDPVSIRYLIECGRKIGIQVLFTPENVKTAAWLVDAGLDDVKIASSTLTDRRLLSFANQNFKRIYISTGMATVGEIKSAVRALRKVRELFIMHCVSEYPTGPLLEKRGLRALASEDVRLNMMKIIKGLFPSHRVGYSDHTSGILAPIAAVAAGAEVIEKHITLDRKMPIRNFNLRKRYMGTDHVLSAEPKELREMVRSIREIEKMFGPSKWERSEGEKVLRDFLRGRFTGA